MKVDVEKMRHRIERLRVLSADRQRAEWLAAMTPEHRARHDNPWVTVSTCFICLAEHLGRVGEAMRAATR